MEGKSMSRRRGNKLKYQVEQALKEINFIGVSKKKLRDLKIETGIHSIKQMKHALSVGQNFASWLKKQGVNDLYQLKRAHYRNYIEFMKNSKVSNGYLINIETNLRILAKGMGRISQKKGMKPRDWVPSMRLIDVKSREKPRDRSYTDKEIESFREKLPDSARISADLQLAFGLRLRETAETKRAHIIEKNGKLYWCAVSDKNALNTAVGVTKAGRGRIAPCKPDMEARIREIIKDKQPADYIVPIKYNTLKSAYNRVNLKGSHTFRHSYARQMLMNEFKRLGIANTGYSMLRRMLENYEKGYRKDYLVTKEEKNLYKKVNECVDHVHSWLGHGRGRIDLCEVYMNSQKLDFR